MKVGIRKPSIKKRVKARTTGKLKRSIKRSVNPTYGKKGMGWVNDPKKAAYNKVYNKTTSGVTNLSSTTHSNKSAEKSSNHSGSAELFGDLNEDLITLNKCADLLTSTTNPNTFFKTYDTYMKTLKNLASAEKQGIKFEGESPQAKYQTVKKKFEKVKAINDFIDRYWNETSERAEKKTSPEEKTNIFNAFSKAMSLHEKAMPEQCIDYYKSKLGQCEYKPSNYANGKKKTPKTVSVPVDTHENTLNDKLVDTLGAFIIFLIASVIIIFFVAGLFHFITFAWILTLVSLVAFIAKVIKIWKSKTKTEYKYVDEDKLSDEDKEAIEKEKINNK